MIPMISTLGYTLIINYFRRIFAYGQKMKLSIIVPGGQQCVHWNPLKEWMKERAVLPGKTSFIYESANIESKGA